MNIIRRDQFTGSNNIAKPERLPEGAVVDAVNMDFTVGGKAELRTGFTKIRDGQNIRALFDMGAGAIAIVEDDRLVKIDNGVEKYLADLSSGPVAATLHNGKLYLNTLAESIVIGDTVEPWAIDPPSFDVNLKEGQLKSGVYKVAVTKVVNGVESGCWPVSITVAEGQSLVVTSSGSIDYRLYSSVANGKTLYYQGIASSYNEITSPVDDTARLETGTLAPLPFCDILVSHNGMIIGASGRFLYYTKPLHPNLHDPVSGNFQYPSDITLVAPVLGGVYVCADKTYFISAIASPEMSQRVVADYGAITGTLVTLPNRTVAWFTKHGQVIAGQDGVTELLNQGSYSPNTAERGASSLLEHNGNQTILTTMRGSQNDSRLSSTDYWEIEVL